MYCFVVSFDMIPELEKRRDFEKYVTNESSYVLEYMADSNKDG